MNQLTILGLMIVATASGCSALSWFGESDSFHSAVDPKSRVQAEAQNEKGLKYLAKGRPDKAEIHFQKALQLDPNSASAHNNMGNILFARRELYLAAWEFERAAALAPRDVSPLINLGLVYDEASRFAEAIRYYQDALELEPNNPIAFGNLVRIYVKQDGDPLEIHSMLQQLILIDSRADWVAWAEDLMATRYAILRQSVMSVDNSPLKSEPARASVSADDNREALPTPTPYQYPPGLPNGDVPNLQGPILMQENHIPFQFPEAASAPNSHQP